MKVLIFDNYDSFTYNLVHLTEKILGKRTDVYRNDKIPLEKIKSYDKIILSPGPGVPSEAGLLLPLIRMYAPTHSILGVCLGHQAIAEAFGGQLFNLKTVFHGIATECRLLLNDKIFKEVPSVIEIGRYHSWAVDKTTFPKDLEITAEDKQGNIMALRHKKYDVRGVQFHPESILTPMGEKIITNWLMDEK